MLKLTDEQMRACYASGYFRRYTFEFDEFTLDAEVIHTESVIIKEAICEDTELKLGGCIASSCEFEVSETVTDNINLSGLRFKAYLHLYRASEDESSGDYDNPDKAIGEEIGVIPMGVYNVRSVEMIDDADYKKVTAYDDLYDWDVDISEWYNDTVPTSIKNVTYTDADENVVDASSGIPSGSTRKTTTELVGVPLGAVRCSLLKYLMSLNGNFDSEKYNQAVSKPYMNDEVMTTKTLQTDGSNSVMGIELLRYLCELAGGFGRINRYGVFEIVSLGATGGLYPENNIFPEDSKGADGNLYPEDNFVYLGGDSEDEETPDFISTHYEEYNVQPISCVSFYTHRDDGDSALVESTESSEAKTVSYPENTTGNPYISSNPFTLQMTEDELKTVAKNIYESISTISYRPNSTTLQGVPYYEVGDYYNVTKKISFESFLFSRTITGIQGLRDEFTANGLEIRENSSSPYENIYATMGENYESSLESEELGDSIEDNEVTQTSVFEHDSSHFLSVVASSQYAWDDNKNQIDEYGFGEPTLDYKLRYKAVLPERINQRLVVQDWGLPEIDYLDEEEMEYCYCDDDTGYIYIPISILYYYAEYVIRDYRYWKKIGRAQDRIEEKVFDYDASDVGMTYLDENTGKLYRLTGWNLSSDNPQFRWDFYKQLEKVTVQLETRIEQTSEEIALEASKRYAEDSYLSSRISVTADAITSEVNALKGENIELRSSIEQTATSINAEVTRATKAEGNLSSRITINANGIATKVEKNGVISSINQSSERITINANRINLVGYVTATDLSGSGTTTINGANITTGTISANLITGTMTNSASFGKLKIGSDSVYIGTEDRGTTIRQNEVVCEFIRGYASSKSLLIGASNNYQTGATIELNNKRIDFDGNVYSSGIRDATTSAVANGYVNSNTGHMGRSTASSKRYKHDITTDIKESLSPHKLLDLPVSQYKYNIDYLSNSFDQRYNIDIIGFIAEDVAEHYPVACEFDDYGMVENWNERYLIPPMLSLIQEMYQKINVLENEIIKLGGNIT